MSYSKRTDEGKCYTHSTKREGEGGRSVVISGRAYKYKIFYINVRSKHSRSLSAQLRSTSMPVAERPGVPERVNATRPGARAKNGGQRVRTRGDRGTWGKRGRV